MPDSAAPASMFVTRDACISCGSTSSLSIATGFYGDEPLRSFIDNDPWGENPMPLLCDEKWDLRQCTSCGQRQHRHILSPQWNEIRFSKWMSQEAIRKFEEEHGSNHDAARDVQHVLRLKAMGVKRVLDFGCGFGQFLEMCQLFGIEAVGVDRSIGRRSGAAVQVYAELDDAPGTFDAITLFEVLEHLDDPLGMLRALKDRLNPGGVFVMEVPNTSGVNGIFGRSDYYSIHPLDHINAFTPESLVNIAAKVGLKPVKRKPAFVTTSLNRVAKDVLKESLRSNTTQRYFRATSRSRR